MTAYQPLDRSSYPPLQANISELGEPLTLNVLRNAARQMLVWQYQKLGYPLGKSIKGLKKWAKKQTRKQL